MMIQIVCIYSKMSVIMNPSKKPRIENGVGMNNQSFEEEVSLLLNIRGGAASL